jgi:prophage regulatory protein
MPNFLRLPDVKRFLRLPDVRARTCLSKSEIYKRMRMDPPTFPMVIKLGPRTSAWSESEIDAWMEEQIRPARGGTIATAIEQADGFLGALGGEARNGSTSSMPTVSEPPMEPIKTRSPRREHHLDRIRRENTRSPREHHLNELERIRRENEMAEAE